MFIMGRITISISHRSSMTLPFISFTADRGWRWAIIYKLRQIRHLIDNFWAAASWAAIHANGTRVFAPLEAEWSYLAIGNLDLALMRGTILSNQRYNSVAYSRR